VTRVLINILSSVFLIRTTAVHGFVRVVGSVRVISYAIKSGETHVKRSTRCRLSADPMKCSCGEIRGIDDERVPFSSTSRVPMPLPDALWKMRPPAERNDADIVDLSDKHQVSGGLQNPGVAVVSIAHVDPPFTSLEGSIRPVALHPRRLIVATATAGCNPLHQRTQGSVRLSWLFATTVSPRRRATDIRAARATLCHRKRLT
jgi:hypothetical protein